jgi:nitrogen regulatory protein P-II 1
MENNTDFCKVTAIIRTEALEKVAQCLQELGVPGISVTQVKGHGEYANFYNNDLMTDHARVEVFIPAQRADEVAQTIVNVAHSGIAGDGIVAVLPVKQLYRIRTRESMSPNQKSDK